jgi:uncharacterized membrane protein YbjE (DUF340 family)
MGTILILMFSGILLGFIFRRKRVFIQVTEKITGLSIYLLLFLLGMSVGVNDKVISNFASIGIIAITLAFSGIAGSIILSVFVYRFFFRQD